MRISNEIKLQKIKLRRIAINSRLDLAKSAGPRIGTLLIKLFFDQFVIKPEEIISGYWPIGSEIDLKPLMYEIDRLNNNCFLPVVRGLDEILYFHKWQPSDELIKSDLGILEPPVSKPIGIPNMMLVPLLAFDIHGYRIGYGGGFYDRTIQNLRSESKKKNQKFIAIGIGYAGQKVDSVPHDNLDQRMDWIMTEEEVLKF